jgi:hypothetical protein
MPPDAIEHPCHWVKSRKKRPCGKSNNIFRGQATPPKKARCPYRPRSQRTIAQSLDEPAPVRFPGGYAWRPYFAEKEYIPDAGMPYGQQKSCIKTI